VWDELLKDCAGSILGMPRVSPGEKKYHLPFEFREDDPRWRDSQVKYRFSN
jgi:hypothetical protein